MTGYDIKVREQLDPRLASWLGGVTITHTRDGHTLLSAPQMDQAALYSVLARCRDLGIVLISVKPISSPISSNSRPASAASHRQGDTTMNTIHAEATDIINARPQDVYAVLADYRNSHPQIVPKQFFEAVKVLKGGTGAGTEIEVHVKAFGVRRVMRQVVSEPEPGRILVEADPDGSVVTTFIVDPVDGGQRSRVTIATDSAVRSGIAGWIEAWMTPPLQRRIYRLELRQLDAYMQQAAAPVAQPARA